MDFLICSLMERDLIAAGALGTDWWEEAGGLTSHYMGDATFPTSSYFPTHSQALPLDQVPL